MQSEPSQELDLNKRLEARNHGYCTVTLELVVNLDHDCKKTKFPERAYHTTHKTEVFL